MHGLARWLGRAPYIIIEENIYMKTHWPFDGFFLKLSDEQNGTHEYEDYLKECEGEKQMPEEELEFHYSKDPTSLHISKVIDGTAWFVLQYSWRVRCPFCVVWVW